jgi:hypothetical protein
MGWGRKVPLVDTAAPRARTTRKGESIARRSRREMGWGRKVLWWTLRHPGENDAP